MSDWSKDFTTVIFQVSTKVYVGEHDVPMREVALSQMINLCKYMTPVVLWASIRIRGLPAKCDG